MTLATETPPVPKTAAELEEMLVDDTARASLLDDPARFGQWVRNYAHNLNEANNAEIPKLVKAEVEKATAEFLRDNVTDTPKRLDVRDATDAILSPKGALNNPRALGAALNGDFRNSSEFFAMVARPEHAAPELVTKVRNALGSNVPSDGGFLIPETMRSEMLRLAQESSVVRGNGARVIPMETLRVPFPTVDSTSNVSSVFGGVVAYWTEEGATLTASSPTFGRVVLDAKKLTAYTAVPSELLSDSLIALQAFIDEIFPEALAWYEDIAFIKGSGVGEPLGALSTANPAIIAVAKETGQAAATIVWENIVKMYSRMLPTSLGSAVWVVTPDAFPELATMALSVGTGGAPVWLNNGVVGPPASILGRPVIVSEKAPAVLGSQGDISFVDFKFYLIGDRQAMTAARSTDYLFGSDQVAFRIIERVDGRPWLQSAITPQNNGSTLSPFVQLAVRS